MNLVIVFYLNSLNVVNTGWTTIGIKVVRLFQSIWSGLLVSMNFPTQHMHLRAWKCKYEWVGKICIAICFAHWKYCKYTSHSPINILSWILSIQIIRRCLVYTRLDVVVSFWEAIQTVAVLHTAQERHIPLLKILFQLLL